ncbi:MAG: Gfo/Idh/MocA family oxidoreductase [Planctomycetes bacterium]|nr:Gfo/Idh/MocA family oxidoreductase [Planctomycetota bacterium]
MSRKLLRRDFVKGTAAVGVGVWTGLAARESKAANEQIAFGCIGIGGKGGSDSASANKAGDVVAICDVDDDRLDGAAKRYGKAQKFNDYRKLLDKVGKSLDAVTVSTPDHTHAPAAIRAMKLGLHCFCQKPLTHSVYEARQMAEIARDKKLATQMGNQGTANSKLREASAIIKSGALGTIKEVHVWTNRPVWGQGGPRPKPADPPKNLHWDLWLGAAPYRPFGVKVYHPFEWRGWWDFGTGALGDMACHTFNMPYMACDLYDPTSIEAESSGHNKDSYPKWSVIKFAFPANKIRPAIPVTWYDGGKLPDKSVLDGAAVPKAGAVVIGSKGKLYGHGDYCGSFSMLGVDQPKVDFERSPGHFVEFARAIKGGPKARSSFDGYAGGLTETILLGNLAVWAGKKIEWDAKNLKATNAPEVEIIIRKKYRKGFGLG